MFNENIRLQRLIFGDDNLTTSERIVALCLIWHRNTRTKQCNPGQATIARETGLKERAVRSALHGLVGKEVIRSTRTQKTTRYEFLGLSGSLNGLAASGAGLDRHVRPVGSGRENRELELFKAERELECQPKKRRRKAVA